jgi:hypothetical protein
MASLRFTNFTIWLAMLVIYSVYFLTENQLIPQLLTNLTDLCAILVFFAFMLEAVRGEGFKFPVKYVLYATLLMLLVAFSALVNQKGIGSIMLGVKIYFAYIPFFLLPFACRFDEEKIKHFLKALFVIALIQVPLALFQRFVQHADRMHNGDIIFGTLGISSFLSMFLVSTMALLMGFYLRKHLGLAALIGLVFFLFIPTTINETKGTVIILPLAFMAPAVAHAFHTGRVRMLIPIAGMAALFIAGFLFIFSQFEEMVFGRELGDQDLTKYTFQDKDIQERTSDAPVIGKIKRNREKDVGRGDAMVLPFKILSKDIFSMAFGVGLGNTSETSIEFLAGDYKQYEHLKPDYTVVSKVTWDLGALGLLAAFGIMALVAWDVWAVSARESFVGDFALGWLGVLAVIGFSMFYKDLVFGKVISAFFWFFSGYICSQRVYMPRPQAATI